eukprot:1156677-Pelagomonas_calceolata.AAC.5
MGAPYEPASAVTNVGLHRQGWSIPSACARRFTHILAHSHHYRAVLRISQQALWLTWGCTGRVSQFQVHVPDASRIS